MATKPRKPASPPEPFDTPNETELPERWSVQRKSEPVLRLLFQSVRIAAIKEGIDLGGAT